MSDRITPAVWDAPWWTSEVYLPAFARCRDRWSAHGEQPDRRTERERLGWVRLYWPDVPSGRADDPPPLDAARSALESLFREEAGLCEAVLAEVLESYRTHCRADFSPELGDAALADHLGSLAGIRETMSLGAVHLLGTFGLGRRYVGLVFNATWAEDHGVGVVLQGGRVVVVGTADEVWCFAGEAGVAPDAEPGALPGPAGR